MWQHVDHVVGQDLLVSRNWTQLIRTSCLFPVKIKKDLLALCSSGAIPDVYHNFYASLPSSNEIVETLQEPDVLDESEPENDEFEY